MNRIVRRAFSRFSLRVVMTTVIVALLALTAGVTWYLTWRNGQASIRELADQVGRQGMANIRQHLESYLAIPPLVNEINVLALQESGEKALTSPWTIRKLEKEIDYFRTVVSVAWADAHGTYFGVSRAVEGVPLELGVCGPETGYHLEGWELTPAGARVRMFDRSSKPFDPRVRPWYRAAVSAGRPTWSPIYQWVTGDAGIDAVTPVYALDEEIEGVFDTSLTLSGIGDFLQGIRVTAHTAIFITDRQGMIVAASSIATPHTTRQGQMERPLASESEDPVVRAGARLIARELGSGDGLTAGRQFPLGSRGKPGIMFVEPFRGPGIDWVIAEVIPESDFAQHIYDDMRSTAFVVAGFLFLAGAIGLLLARRVSAPLEALSTMARSLAEGKLSQTIHVEGTDEIGKLAESFNHMAAELRRSFASLAESTARYRAFVATSAAAIIRLEAQEPMPLSLAAQEQADWLYERFFIAEYNEAAGQMLGAGPGTGLLGGSLEQWLPRSESASRDAVRGMIVSRFEVANAESALRRDGSMLWFLHSVSGVVEDDRLVRLWCVLRDISDQKRAEEALRRSETRYRAIFHRSAVSLWEVDISSLHAELETLSAAAHQDLAALLRSDRRLLERALHLAKVVDVNETTLHLFEAKSREELLGPLDATFDPDVLAPLVPQAIAGAEKGRQHDIETTVLTRSGRPLNVIMHFHVPARNDSFSSLLVSVVDITKRTQAEQERAALEEQLRQAQKMESVGRLAGGISHDINNLLTPILGHAELVADDAAAKIILGSAQRIRDLSQKLLALSRKQHLAKSVVDLRGVVRDFYEFLRRTIRENVEMRVEAPREIGLVTVDVGQFEQVLLNLAINAQDAMPEGGVMTFTLRDALIDEELARGSHGLSPGEYVSLTVSDTGIGMDETTRRHVFEPFFTTKEPGKGTGLGLSTVYGIVKQHGGHIDVISEPGVGSSFAIYLPRQRENPAQKAGTENVQPRRFR